MTDTGFFPARDGARLFFSIDDFTDRWRKPEAIICVHGLAESTEAWTGWVPHLARDFRVVRFDMRGFGRSPAMSAGHVWSLDELSQDIDDLLSAAGLESAHIVGCKSGGTIAMAYAIRFPAKVRTLSVVGSNPAGPPETWLPFIEEHGVERWLRETMPRRLASLSPEAMEWWINLMGKTPLSTLQGYLRWYPTVNLIEDIRKITAPTLAVVGKNPLRKSDQKNEWQKRIPNSRLEIVDVESSHLGGAFPDLCADIVCKFAKEHSAAP